MRIYAYVPSINPLRVYLYPDGVVKFATKKFTTDDLDSMVHLTNIEVNAKNPAYTLDYSLKTGHKWSLNVLKEYLRTNNGTDWMPIWENIKDIVLKTIISGEPEIWEGVRKYLQSKYSGHELFGFDILLDNNMKPWVLEVNKSPGLYPHSGHFRPVNDPMAKDMLNLAGFRIPSNQGTDDRNENTSGSDVPDHLLLDKRWWSQTLSGEEKAKQKYYCDNHKNETILSTILDNLTPDDIRVLVDTIDENSRRGGFDRIFPRLDTDKYFRFFQKPRYYNILIHQWLKRFHKNETEGISLVEAHCKELKHLTDQN
ncbi:tubulin polyglutamylase TTLL4-like [Lingula anatina]|uniref:Tubulin polyglutamylase TTLL4-like n=1 Tax=Lingula anatina TaxID=7574 RepID=A0A1S3HTX0_LINAN|nr:tubulin polyglutamylase TTLL4-like [Lingula anatina]|eukprot:XP_013388991.1 tubulin polyglutamylase TTLL4-like [Lingula anatina]